MGHKLHNSVSVVFLCMTLYLLKALRKLKIMLSLEQANTSVNAHFWLALHFNHFHVRAEGKCQSNAFVLVFFSEYLGTRKVAHLYTLFNYFKTMFGLNGNFDSSPTYWGWPSSLGTRYGKQLTDDLNLEKSFIRKEWPFGTCKWDFSSKHCLEPIF